MTTLAQGDFLGEKLRTAVVPGFRFTETGYTPGAELPYHTHARAKICCVLSGSYTEAIGGREHLRSRNMVLYQPPGTPHAELHREPGRHFIAEVEPSIFESLDERTATTAEPFACSEGQPAWIAERLYEEFQSQEAFAELSLQGLGLELLAAMLRTSNVAQHNHAPPWLRHVRGRLQREFADNPALSTLAADAGVHPVHLARAFRQHYGSTVGDYVRQLRLDFAVRMLRDTQTPLSTISAQAGFADQSHFSRTFRTHFGMSPGDFRRSR